MNASIHRELLPGPQQLYWIIRSDPERGGIRCTELRQCEPDQYLGEEIFKDDPPVSMREGNILTMNGNLYRLDGEGAKHNLALEFEGAAAFSRGRRSDGSASAVITSKGELVVWGIHKDKPRNEQVTVWTEGAEKVACGPFHFIATRKGGIFTQGISNISSPDPNELIPIHCLPEGKVQQIEVGRWFVNAVLFEDGRLFAITDKDRAHQLTNGVKTTFKKIAACSAFIFALDEDSGLHVWRVGNDRDIAPESEIIHNSIPSGTKITELNFSLLGTDDGQLFLLRGGDVWPGEWITEKISVC